jgi:hypothetical protein
MSDHKTRVFDGIATVEVARIPEYNVSDNLFAHMEDLRGILDGIPAQYRADTRIEVMGDGHDSCALVIYYKRPATADELAMERTFLVTDAKQRSTWLRGNITSILELAAKAELDPKELGIEVLEDRYVIQR